jgi:Ca2+/H+ antiporter, TMEM165/GDT1 family
MDHDRRNGSTPATGCATGVVAALAITGGRGLLRILPMRWISRLAALVMVVMAAVTVGEAIR